MTAVFVIEQKIKIHIFKISFAILGYLEAKFDYDYFILFLAQGYHDSTCQIWSHFEQNLRRGGHFCDFVEFASKLALHCVHSV